MELQAAGTTQAGSRARGALILVLATIVAFGLSCSGDKKPTSDGGSGGGGGGSGSNGIGVASLPQPVKVDLPQGRGLVGPLDEETSLAIAAAFTRAGANLTGVKLSVYPIAGVRQSMLVLDIDLAKASESQGDAIANVVTILTELPEARAANITRIVTSFPGKDAQGDFVLLLNAHIDYFKLLNDPASADLSDEEGEKKFRELVKVELVR